METRQEKHEVAEHNTESSGTVLIVEDSQGVNRLIQKRLEREGFRTEQAWNGTEAVAKVEENPDMIMILDYILPDMTARQILEALTERNAMIPFVIMTGHGDEQVAVDMMKLGAKDYIVKQGNFIEILSQIVKRVYEELDTEKRLAEAELSQKESEQRFRKVIMSNTDAMIVVDKDNVIRFANPSAGALFDRRSENLVGEFFGFPITGGESTEFDIPGQKGIISTVEMRTVEIEWDDARAYLATLRDITEKKKAEQRQQLTTQVLALLNTTEKTVRIIQKILLLIKDFADVDAVGLRLQEGEDFPFYEMIGFSKAFMETECYLGVYDQHGELLRDSEGYPVLECMCGNVIRGKIDPSLPFFTEGGSFWTNSTTELLAAMAKEDHPAYTRNHCHSAGYESVALIPLRSNDDIIGLFQLNGRRKNIFTDEMIRFFEGIGASIGIAITRKQTEEKLLQLRKAVETMPLGVTITDLDKKILYTNPADAIMHGYTVEELLGQDARIFAPAELRQPMSLEQIETSKNWIRESVNTRKDCSRFLVHLKSDIVRDVDGQAIAIVTTCEDITERKRAEEALKLSEQNHRTLFETMMQGVVYLDVEGRIILANPAAERILGMSLAQMQDKTFMELPLKVIHEDGSDFPADTHPAMLALKTGKQINDIVMGILNPHEEQYRWLNIYAIPQFRPGENTPYQVYKTFIDITEQKRTMEELRQARDMLEQRVAERTAELTLLNEELARASRLKDEFLANMSHDLRTPLNAILGYAQILKDAENLDEHQVEALGTIKNSGEYLLSMINDILDLSKIEAGRMELQIGELHLSNFLQSITDMIRVRAEQKGVSVVYERTADLPVGVYADEKRLGEVLMNLLGNAVKFTEQGSVTFRVKVCRDRFSGLPTPDPSQEGNERTAKTVTTNISTNIRFEVEDTGIGITPEQLGEIFLPFHQVGDNYHSLEGTGLGLAISRKLVEMMGGELKVKSALGKGSLFWFELEMSEVPGFVQKVQSTTPRILDYTGKRRIAMVVDDVQENRAMLTSMLLPLGFQVVEAENGQECLEKSRKCTPDVILLDLLMPGIDGFEVARQIRKLDTGYSRLDTGYSILDTSIKRPVSSDQYPASSDQYPVSSDQYPVSSDQYPASSDQYPVIIAISASAFKEVQRKSLEAGCNEFLAKPFEKDDLLELLRRHLCLEWVYEEKAEAKTGEDVSIPLSPEIIASLPSGERKKLLQQAVRGNVKGILKQLDTIEHLGEQFLPLVTELRTLAKSFQVDQIVELLEAEGKHS